MEVDFKFFNFSSIKIKKRTRYQDKNLEFDNHIKNYDRAIKGVKILAKEMLWVQKTSETKIIKRCTSEQKHWALKESNQQVEPVLLVLMGYGYSRDFVINHIFDGYNSKNLSDSDNMVLERFLTRAKIVKMPLTIGKPCKERLMAIIKAGKFFPLFVDINHSLYHSHPKKTNSKLKLEFLFKDFLTRLAKQLD